MARTPTRLARIGPVAADPDPWPYDGTQGGPLPDLSDLPANKRWRSAQIGGPGPQGRILVRGEYGHGIVDELAPHDGEVVIDKPGKGSTTLCVGVVQIPQSEVFGIILPALGIQLLIGNGYYTYLARRLARRENHSDVCAMPYGPNVPHIFIVTFVIMLPIFLSTRDPIRAWVAGLAWSFIIGLIVLLGALIPLPAIVPILLYIGLLIGAPAFVSVPKAHAVAVVLAVIPNVAAWATGQIDNVLNAAGTSATEVGSGALAQAGVAYDGLKSLGGGAILAGMVLGAIAAFMIDKRYYWAAGYCVAGAVLSFIGLIHGEQVAWAAAPGVALGYLLAAVVCLAFSVGSTPEPGRRLRDTDVLTVDHCTAVVTTLFDYPDRPIEGRQTQVWVHLPEGWRIVSAHVSEVSTA